MLKLKHTLERMHTQMGDSVFKKSCEKDVLLVFLRHFGCIFCREAMEELSKLKATIAHHNTELVLVHMSTDEVADKYFQRYDLIDVARISDPECKYYKEFGLLKGTFNQLFGFRSWFRGIEAGVIKGYGFGMQLGDGFQMPGVFLIRSGMIITEFRHKYASDKPDYLKMVNCPSPHTSVH